jgi:YfiH family protein
VAWIRLDLGGTRVLFTDRTGGVSDPPFHSANLGYGRGDDPTRVLENRRRAGAALGGRAADPGAWATLHQVHGSRVVVPKSPVARPATAVADPEGDAAASADSGAVLAVLTADCGPVALVAGGAAAAVHAGWRGVGAGVLEAAVDTVRRLSGETPRAVLGPCVRPCCYEFGSADLEPLVSRLGAGIVGRTRTGATALDLSAAITTALTRAGVKDVADTGVCTACSPDHFSHRRDGRGGLQALIVARPE